MHLVLLSTSLAALATGPHGTDRASCATGSPELAANLARLMEREPVTVSAPKVSSLGGLVIMEDDGSLTDSRGGSVWDLEDADLVLEPRVDDGFDATLTHPATVDPDWGDLVTTFGDEWGQTTIDLPFLFPFGTSAHQRLYLSSGFDIYFYPEDQPYSTSQYSQAELTGGPPRITPLARPSPWIWADHIDLYAKIEADRVTLTWHEQTTYPESQPHLDRRFQVVLDDAGAIHMAYPDAKALNTFGAVQVNTGVDEPDLVDVSVLGTEPMPVTGLAQAFTLPQLDVYAVKRALKHAYGFNDNNLDAIAMYQTFYTEITFYAGAYHTGGSSGDSGFGADSQNKRTSLLHMNHIDLSWNYRDEGTMASVLNHEFGHRWLFFIQGVGEMKAWDSAHPRKGAHLPAASPWYTEDDGSSMGGTSWLDLGGGEFATPPLATYYGYSWLELYLMGLADPVEVNPFWYVSGPEELAAPYFPEPDSIWEGVRVDHDIDDVIAANGPRQPLWPDAQRGFDIAMVLVTRRENPAGPEDLVNVRDKMSFWPVDWHAAVQERAVLNLELDRIIDEGPGDCDFDGISDETDPDTDADRIADKCDACPGYDDREDADHDGVADGCDICADSDDTIDNDEDGVPNGCDRCPGYDDAIDDDGDGAPNACDLCAEADDTADDDGDGVPNDCDICPAGDDALDGDMDGVPNACDICVGPETGDEDGDGIPDECDACPGVDDAEDIDGDGMPDPCDPCPTGHIEDDEDNDGTSDACDLCPGANDTQDADGDGVPDSCDACQTGDDGSDADSDGVPDACDKCDGADDGLDGDLDGIPDGCEVHEVLHVKGKRPAASKSCSSTGGSPLRGLWAILGLTAFGLRCRRRIAG